MKQFILGIVALMGLMIFTGYIVSSVFQDIATRVKKNTIDDNNRLVSELQIQIAKKQLELMDCQLQYWQQQPMKNGED